MAQRQVPEGGGTERAGGHSDAPRRSGVAGLSGDVPGAPREPDAAEARGRGHSFTGGVGLPVAAIAWRLALRSPSLLLSSPSEESKTWAFPSSRPEAPAAPA